MRVLQESFYMTLGNFFSGGTYNNVFLGLFSELNENLKSSNASIGKLNESIRKADESSGALAEALNKITFWGTIIAAASLIIAVTAVALEYYKFFSVQ